MPSTEFDALVDVAKQQVAAGDLRGLVGVNFRLSKRNIDEPLFAKL